ncbi:MULTISPECIES: R3H domain-containing nucleic acid-binding protein [Nesterenkonia]|uniref:Jag family protein n=1 Tax=Nesterenkonia TaxID=57494 RepID=UPI0011B4FE0B|nr:MULTISPECIES: R3H domain-containing nucleic acid-binding protein [Nesterenkonia]
MTETSENPAENPVLQANETVAPEEAHVVENQDTVEELPEEDSDGEDDSDDETPDEGDVAADYLEELLDIVDLDGDIEIEIRGERTFISIQAEDGGAELQDLVGTDGETLDALQELTRLAVLSATGHRTRLVLDINGHRNARNEELRAKAQEAVQKVKDTGEEVPMEPMSAFERKIVHDFIAEAGLTSGSEGEGRKRHVVVSA